MVTDGLISISEDNESYYLITWVGSLNERKTLIQTSLKGPGQSPLKKGSLWVAPGAMDLKGSLFQKAVWETRIQN